MHPYVNIASNAAREAGKIIARSVDNREKLKIYKKLKNDFVTQIDQYCEKIIIEHIRKNYPKHGILAEESGEIFTDNSDTRWIIDPIDGNSNFIHGLPYFCISIAVEIKSIISHAVIYNPMNDELFSASKGEGAQLNRQRLRINHKAEMAMGLIGTGFHFFENQDITEYIREFKAVTPHCAGVRSTGSAALDLAYVASGRLLGFWEKNLKPWDIAAGILLIKEAGGYVSDYTGQDRYLKNGEVIAGSPKIYTKLIQLVRNNNKCKTTA